MIDFLKTHPSVNRDDYLWGWTAPQIELAICDNTHVEYLSEEQAKIEKLRREGVQVDGSSKSSVMTDLGIPVF